MQSLPRPDCPARIRFEMIDLNDAYANAAHIPDGMAYPQRWANAAAAFRSGQPKARLDVAYGPSDRQVFDFFPAEDPRGTLIFVHGGFWRAFDGKSWSHFASGALALGWNVALPSYDLCPHVRIAAITQQIAQAVMQIADETEGSLVLAGHSAGGHLVARMLAPGILPATVRERIRHVMPISPLSDLEPLIRTDMNADFRLDADMARAESPLLQPRPETPVTIWVGADERPVFLDQAAWLADHWGAEHVVAENRHHFDVIDDLQSPGSDMMRRLLPVE